MSSARGHMTGPASRTCHQASEHRGFDFLPRRRKGRGRGRCSRGGADRRAGGHDCHAR